MAGLLFLLAQNTTPFGALSYAQFSISESKELEERLSKTIFLDLRDINVVDILKFLAVQGNLNIVTSKNVQGRSTLVLRDVKIGDALEILLISNQLAYELKGSVIYIMTEDEYVQAHGKNFNDKKKVLTRKLEYTKPSYAMAAVQAVQSTIGKVVVDEETGTIVMIDTPEKLLQMNSLLDDIERRLDTKIVQLKYANAKDVEAQLKPGIDGKGVGTVYGDERSNQLLLTAYPGRMQTVLPVVTALDKKTKAVLIEARILKLSLNPKYDFGINWEKTFENSPSKDLKNLDFRGAFPINSAISTATSLGTIGKIAAGKFDDTEFALELKALKQVEDTKVLANPRLMILNRQEAKINIGDRVPYVVTTSTGTGNNISVSEEIKFIDVGIMLAVTPIINDDGYISMKIRPEISSQTGTLTTPTKNQIPLVNTTFIETSVIVQDGVTIILGGLRRDDVGQKRMGIPFLMDLPYVGNLFKSIHDSIQRSEIVILLTPKIVSGDKDILDQPLSIKGDTLSPFGRRDQNIFDSSRLTKRIAGKERP